MKKTGKILEAVISRVTPAAKEIAEERRVFEIAMKRVLSVKGKHVRAVLAGSTSRNTHLKGDKDIDLFVMFPKEMPREEFEKEGLRVAKKAFGKTKWEIDYGEHPYLKTVFLGHELEVIPCYEVKSASERQSAVDRTPFHNAYVLSKLKKGQENEVRLLKRFMKGIGCYGAELKTQGFSGYLCELLVLRHRSFAKLLKEVSKWKSGTAITIERTHSLAEARKRFRNSAFVVIDPTDESRNVAAAVSEEKFNDFRNSAKGFLAKPSMEYFFPSKAKALGKKELEKLLARKKMLLLVLPYSKSHEDVVYGQLKKAASQLERRLELHEFQVKRKAVFSDDSRECAILLELKEIELPETRLHPGPPATMKEHSRAFIEKHGKGAKQIVVGGRLHVLIKRKHIRAKSVALEFAEGLALNGKSWIEKRARKKFAIYEGREIFGALKEKGMKDFVAGF